MPRVTLDLDNPGQIAQLLASEAQALQAEVSKKMTTLEVSAPESPVNGEQAAIREIAAILRSSIDKQSLVMLALAAIIRAGIRSSQVVVPRGIGNVRL